MSSDTSLPILDHDLAADELAWMAAVRADFRAARAACTGPTAAFDPKAALREILHRAQHRLATPMDFSGPGPWRLGRNRHDRGLAAVFLPKVELHAHAHSRTDQFPIYVIGAADGFSLDDHGAPLLTPVTEDGHFHNPPGAPHAFLPKVGQAVPENWEIAFIAITPRNLREDTQAVSEPVRAAYERVVGRPAPHGV